MSDGWNVNHNPIIKKIELRDNRCIAFRIEVYKEDVYVSIASSSIRLTKEQYEELRFFMVMG